MITYNQILYVLGRLSALGKYYIAGDYHLRTPDRKKNAFLQLWLFLTRVHSTTYQKGSAVSEASGEGVRYKRGFVLTVYSVTSRPLCHPAFFYITKSLWLCSLACCAVIHLSLTSEMWNYSLAILYLRYRVPHGLDKHLSLTPSMLLSGYIWQW